MRVSYFDAKTLLRGRLEAKTESDSGSRWEKQDLRTREGVHRNPAAGQVGTQGQACRGGSLEVGNQVGVLAHREARSRSHQGDLAANSVRTCLVESLFDTPGGIIPMPRPAGIPRPGPTGNYM